MRLFIAIDLSDDSKKYLISVIEKIKKEYPELYFVNKEKLHLTLKFLGNVVDDKINMIIEKLSKVYFDQFSVFLSNFGLFPSETYFRILWVGLKPENKIIELQKKIEVALLDFFQKDKKFQPHITIARIKFMKDKKKFVEFIKNLKIKHISFEVKEFKLIKSILSPKGSKYETIKSFRLE